MALERQYQGKSKRESRGMNKKLIDIDADSNHNDAITGKRSIHQNRKLSTWIGSQWSQKELKHFYEAYRKYGKNWQKVAGVVRSRSKEMVEALYNKNRAYLSLPEGAATVVGLIAMMTDHYNILGGRELESNDESVLFHSQSAASSHGRLYLLKEGQSDGSISRRRRTPRVLVSYLNEKGHVEKCASPNNREPKCTADVGKLAPEAMSTLPEALLKEGSLDVPQTHMKSSPVRNGEEMGQYRDKDFTRDTSDMMKTDGVDSLDIHKNLKKFQGKKPKLQDTENNNFDYFKRMSSASAGLDLLSSVCLRSESDVTLKKAEERIDSFPHFKEKKRESDIIDKANISEPEVMFADDGVNKHKRSDAKEIGYEAVAIPKSSVLATDKLGIDLTLGLGVSEVKHELPLAARKMTKRKHDALVSDIPTVESVSDSLPNKYMKTQDSSSALLNPRQHNTNQENSPSLCLKPVASSASPAAPLNFFDCSVPPAQESELTEVKVFETSQLRACRMVDVAIQVASSLKKGEGAFEKIRNALEAANTSNSREECGISATRFSVPSDTSRHNLSYQYQTTSCTSAPTTTTAIDTTGSELHSTPEQIEMPMPSALISSCVATLLMIQTCTDRRYPPAEVAQILDSAARSLRPCCSENLPIYRDIQMCMGMVKNQMLALIPTT